MSLVSQGAFSLSSFPSVPGKRPLWSSAIPKGSSGLDPVQGCEVHVAPSRDSRVTAPGSVLGMGSAPRTVHTPGLPPSILTLKNGGYFAPLKHLPRDMRHSCSATAPGAPVLLVPWAPQGQLPIYGSSTSSPPLFLFISQVSAPSSLAELGRLCQGGETEAQSSSEMPAEAEGFTTFFRH